MKRKWLWIGAAVVALAFLYVPTLGISGGQLAFYLFLLLCPLMHLFGMHRHGGHGSGDAGRAEPPVPTERSTRAPDPDA